MACGTGHAGPDGKADLLAPFRAAVRDEHPALPDPVDAVRSVIAATVGTDGSGVAAAGRTHREGATYGKFEAF